MENARVKAENYCPDGCWCSQFKVWCKNVKELQLDLGRGDFQTIRVINSTFSRVKCQAGELLSRIKSASILNSGPREWICKFLDCGELSQVTSHDTPVSDFHFLVEVIQYHDYCSQLTYRCL